MSDPAPRHRHLCEVCGRDEMLTATEAMAAGWDHPPGMSEYGTVGPRCCPTCDLGDTAWWALHQNPAAELTPVQRALLDRIAAEPAPDQGT